MKSKKIFLMKIKGCILAALIFLANLSPCLAIANHKSANTFWITIESKIKKHLKGVIDSKKYKYEIIGPTMPMKKFLGNTPNAELKFKDPNMSSPSHIKSLIVSAANDPSQRISVRLRVWKYFPIYKIRKAVSRGQEISPDNIYETTVAIRETDSKLYFRGNPSQKVASMNLRAGTSLKRNMLRHEKLIKTGDYVRVISEGIAIKLEFRCQAASSGDKGESINIHCSDFGTKNQKAIVQDTGIAKLVR